MAKIVITESIDHHSILTSHKYEKINSDSDDTYDYYNRFSKSGHHSVLVNKKTGKYVYYPPEYTGHYGEPVSDLESLDRYLKLTHQ